MFVVIVPLMTQFNITVSPDDEESVHVLLKCILDSKSWMADHFLQINPDITEFFVPSEDKRESRGLCFCIVS